MQDEDVNLMAQKLRTTNTHMGNPRRVWVFYVMDNDGYTRSVGQYDEGNYGKAVIHFIEALGANVSLLPTIAVTPTEYNDWATEAIEKEPGIAAEVLVTNAKAYLQQ